MSVKAIGDAKRLKPIIALFDSGGSDIMINRNAIPKGAIEMIDTKKASVQQLVTWILWQQFN
jgi:hypothetical protein